MNLELMQDLIIAAPMLVLFLISLIPILIKVVRGNRETNPIATLIYNVIGLVFAIGLTASQQGGHKTAFTGAISLDGVSIWTSILVYFITTVALMLGYDHMATRGRQFSEWCFLLVSSAIGMIVLIMSNDLIITFLGIEMMSLCLYILVAMSREQVLSKEAAFKYFVLGSFASAIFLYGIALVYGTAGTTYFTAQDNVPGLLEQVDRLIGTNRIFLAGMGMVVMGFAFKVALFPFHAWAPDVYQGAPTPVTAFMATAVKTATFVAFLRFFHSDGYAQSAHLLTVMSWLAALTIIIGNAAAVMQNNFKRMLAYSSIAHSGYAMIGLIAAGFGRNFNEGASSLLFYLLSYTLMTLGSFALVALLEKAENTSLAVTDVKGLARKYPVLGLSLTALMLSLAGIPPTLGFFGKFYIFSAAIEQDMYWLTFWGVVGSVISVYYYLRPIVMMYMYEDDRVSILTSHFMTRITVIVSAVLIVLVGLFSDRAIHMVRAVLAQF